MKKLLLRSLCAALMAVGLASVASAKVAVGEQAPEFSLTDITGKSHKLSDFKGKTVVLEWVNPECPFVVKHYDKSGNIPGLQKSATGDGVIWLSINSGSKGAQGDFSAEQVAEWSKKTKASPTAYLRDQDGKIGKLYDAKTTPHIYVINPQGILVYNGAIDSIRSSKVEDIAKAENYVTAALAAVKAGKPVVKTTSEPYGCSVKY